MNPEEESNLQNKPAFPLPLAEDELTELATLIKDEAGLIITNYPVLMDKLKNNWIIRKR